MDFSTALASMCEECEIGLLAQVLREIRLRMDVSLRDFAEHINAQNTAYEKKWLLGRGARLRNINKNIVHRWEGSEAQAPSIPIDFGKAELQWIGTILGLSTQEQAQYDQAVLCYLLFDLDERARDICDDHNIQDTELDDTKRGVVVMPEPLKEAGFTDVDLTLWETASAYLQNPSSATEAAYLKARQQLEQRLITQTSTQPHTQASERVTPMKKSESDEKIKQMPQRRKRRWRFLGIAVFVFFVFIAGMLFNNALVGQQASQASRNGTIILPENFELTSEPFGFITATSRPSNEEFALTATQFMDNQMMTNTAIEFNMTATQFAIFDATGTAIVPIRQTADASSGTQTNTPTPTFTPTQVVTRTPIPTFTPTATFTPTQIPPTVPPLITATPLPTSTP